MLALHNYFLAETLRGQPIKLIHAVLVQILPYKIIPSDYCRGIIYQDDKDLLFRLMKETR